MEIIVDTLSFKLCDTNLEKTLDFLNLSNFDLPWNQAGTFNMNYPNSILYEGIRIGFNGTAGWDTYVHLSGKGCRTFEDLNSIDLFSWEQLFGTLTLLIASDRCEITRIDLASDVFDDSLNLQRIEKYKLANKYLTRCSERSIKLTKFGEEIFYVGSTQSLTLMRIYNKKLERGYDPEDKEIEYWYRCELQCRESHAQQIVTEFGNGVPAGNIFCGHVKDHFKFLTKPNKRDGCQSRIPIAGWWNDFLCNAAQIAWTTPKGSEYNMTKLERYALGNAGSSVKTLIKSKNLNANQLYSIYTDPSINLRPDQEQLIKRNGGEL